MSRIRQTINSDAVVNYRKISEINPGLTFVQRCFHPFQVGLFSVRIYIREGGGGGGYFRIEPFVKINRSIQEYHLAKLSKQCDSPGQVLR